jgi:hypothetical protein
MSLLASAKKIYGNKKKLNSPDQIPALIKHIALMTPLERQAVLVQEMHFTKQAAEAGPARNCPARPTQGTSNGGQRVSNLKH